MVIDPVTISTLVSLTLEIGKQVNHWVKGEPVQEVKIDELLQIQADLQALEDLTPSDQE